MQGIFGSIRRIPVALVNHASVRACLPQLMSKGIGVFKTNYFDSESGVDLSVTHAWENLPEYLKWKKKEARINKIEKDVATKIAVLHAKRYGFDVGKSEEVKRVIVECVGEYFDYVRRQVHVLEDRIYKLKMDLSRLSGMRDDQISFGRKLKRGRLVLAQGRKELAAEREEFNIKKQCLDEEREHVEKVKLKLKMTEEELDSRRVLLEKLERLNGSYFGR